jgi:hypothetical protein
MADLRPPNKKLNLHGEFSYFLYDLAVELSSTLNLPNPYVFLTHWNAADNAAKYLLVLTDVARNLTRLHDSVNEAALDIEWAQIQVTFQQHAEHERDLREIGFAPVGGVIDEGRAVRPSRFSVYAMIPTVVRPKIAPRNVPMMLYLAERKGASTQQALQDKIETLSIVRTMVNELAGEIGQAVVMESTLEVSMFNGDDLEADFKELEKRCKEQIESIVSVWTTPPGEDCFHPDGKLKRGLSPLGPDKVKFRRTAL